MGKKLTSEPGAKGVESRDYLTMNLFAPGMTILHRAGLGGLASSLRYIERAWKSDVILTDELPGGPWAEGKPPWDVSAQSITLRFGDPKEARSFLHRLFRLSFRLKDGLLYLPGQYGDMPPSLAVRAEIQAGLTLTFLQHGKTRKLAKNPTSYQVDPEGDGRAVTVEYKTCEWYKHQDGWSDLTEEKSGALTAKSVEIIGPLNPGAVVRHVAFSRDTRIEEPPERALPLYFALLGCLALPVNRGMGVLIVPDVEDLAAFAVDRPLMTPSSMKECRIASAGDAALQAQVRLRARGLIDYNGLPACYSARFRPTTWASQQKSRVETIFIPRLEIHRHQCPEESQDEKSLHLFETALSVLGPRIRMKLEKETRGTGRSKQTIERERYFWTDNPVRPLLADNLATGQLWYRDFVRLCRVKEEFQNLKYQQQGLNDMTEQSSALSEAERVLVASIHQAIRNNFGRIRRETDGIRRETHGDRSPSDATKNRWKRFRERLRLALVGAKTPDQCRNAICTLFANAGVLTELKEGWQLVVPMLRDSRWMFARDLALLALASYARQDEESIDESQS